MSQDYKGDGAKALSKVPLNGVKKSSSKPKMEDSEASKRINSLEKISNVRDKQIADLNAHIIAQKKENENLRQRITEMTQFLADYGLHWVGGPRPEYAAFPNGPLDMNLFNQRINDLSKAAENAKENTIRPNGMPIFDKKHCIHLDLLDKGFTLNGSPIRLYEDEKSGQFFQDIYDGFFPAEFKADHPAGVKIIMTDKRNPEAFKGSARKLLESSRGSREPEEIGEGDGKLKIKLPTGPDAMINIESMTKVRQLRRLLKSKFQLDDNFELCIPPSTKPIDDNATMESLNLYPRGILLATLGNRTSPFHS